MKEIPYLGFAAITHKEGGKSGTMERRDGKACSDL